MEITIKVLIGVISLMMFGLGMMSMFAPKKMIGNFSIEPVGSAGLNTIRGVIGGLFIGSLAMLLAGFATGETIWFLVVAVLLGAVAVGRLVGVAFDGVDKSVVPPLVLEFVMVAILVAGHLLLGTS